MTVQGDPIRICDADVDQLLYGRHEALRCRITRAADFEHDVGQEDNVIAPRVKGERRPVVDLRAVELVQTLREEAVEVNDDRIRARWVVILGLHYDALHREAVEVVIADELRAPPAELRDLRVHIRELARSPKTEIARPVIRKFVEALAREEGGVFVVWLRDVVESGVSFEQWHGDIKSDRRLIEAVILITVVVYR